MTKPIAYYLSDPDDADTLAEIAVTYGDRLERLNQGQKTDLLARILAEIWNRPSRDRGFCPFELTGKLGSFSTDTLLGLLTATAEQLRHDKEAK